MRAICFLCALTAVMPVVGCTSIKSTMIRRDEMNQEWEEGPRSHGVPITLRVPTHLRVAVTERHYLVYSEIGGVPQLTRADICVPIRGVNHDFLFTEKIFTVDFKRPAAGRMTLTLDMEEDRQYFDRIEHEVVDETIKDVTALIGTLMPQAGPAALMAGGLADHVTPVDSVVAVQVFEVDAPDFEQQLRAFLDCHVNKAHDAWVMPPGVGPVQRVPLHNDHIDGPPLCQDTYYPAGYGPGDNCQYYPPSVINEAPHVVPAPAIPAGSAALPPPPAPAVLNQIPMSKIAPTAAVRGPKR